MHLGVVRNSIVDLFKEAEAKVLDRHLKNDALEIKSYNDSDCFDEFTKEWNNLVQVSDSPFCVTKEWVAAWWKHYGENKNRLLYVVVIKNENAVLAIAPFYLGFTKIGKNPVYKRLQIIGSGGSKSEQWGFPNDYGISDFLDIIVNPEYSDIVSDIFVDLFDEYVKFIDEIKFLQVRDDSFLMQDLSPKIQNKNWDYTEKVTDECSYIDLSDVNSIKEYIKKNNSSSARRRFRQTLRAINDDQEFYIRDVDRNSEIIKEAKDRLISLHQDRWNEIGFPGVFHDVRFRRFFDDILNACIKNNWLYFKETIDTEGVSSSRMLIRFNGKYYDYLSGFDPESPSSRYRPGYGLLLEAVEEAITNNIRYVELLRGQESYKHDFTEKKLKNWRMVIKNNRKSNVLKRSIKGLLKITAIFYTIVSKESILINIQYNTVGILKAIPNYISFRWDKVKSKLGS